MKIAIQSLKCRQRGPLRAKSSGKQQGRKKKRTNQSCAATMEEQVVNQAENPCDDEPWWIIFPDLEDGNPPMDFYDCQLSSACSSDDPLPRWVASAIQCEDAQIVQSVVDSVLVNF